MEKWHIDTIGSSVEVMQDVHVVFDKFFVLFFCFTAFTNIKTVNVCPLHIFFIFGSVGTGQFNY